MLSLTHLPTNINLPLSSKRNNSSAPLRQTIPLFAKIDFDLFKILDLSGFIVPKGIIKTYRDTLEIQLGHYVVSYDKNICNLKTPVETHLCARVKGAQLTTQQKKLLEEYEQLSKPLGITFVVYQNPIEYINPSTSAIYGLYKQKGLL